jgi:hypothetical protein
MQTTGLHTEKNEMFVLWSLIALSLRRVYAPVHGLHLPAARLPSAQPAYSPQTGSQTHQLVPIHVPTLRRHV